VWGIVLLALHADSYYLTPGYVTIGFSLICFSTFSKVGLLAMVWRRSFPLADRAPLIPMLAALTCLFLAAFLFQAAVVDSSVFVPARVLVAQAAICFSLFAIVSIVGSPTPRVTTIS
jgi:hypothetical protein